MGRFACDWHRLAVPTPRATGAPGRRNHGPGRTPWSDASPWPVIAEPHPEVRTPESRTTSAAHRAVRRGGRDGDAATGGRPTDAQRPLGLGRGRAGGEHVVADHDVARGRPARARRRSAGGWARKAPARLAARAARVEPGLVGEPGPGPQQRQAPGRTAQLGRAARPRPAIRLVVGSCPRCADRARPRRHGHEQDTGVAGGRRPAGRSARALRDGDRQQLAQRARPARAAGAPCGPGSSPGPCRRTSSRPRARLSPGGAGVGQAGRGCGSSAAAQAPHSSRPGRAQPTQVAAEQQVAEGVEHAPSRPPAGGCRGNRPARAGLWISPRR